MKIKCKMCGTLIEVDANQTTVVCQRCGTSQTNNEKIKKQLKKSIIVALSLVMVIIVCVLVFVFAILPKIRYDNAVEMMDAKQYQDAYNSFNKAGNYSDATEKAKEAYYNLGKEYLAQKDYDKSNPIFENLKDYKDSSSLTHYHKHNVTASKEATCTENGQKTYTCACGDTYTDTITAIGHNYTEATCTAPKTCTRCKATSGEALGHTTGSVKCSRCNATTFKTLTYSGVDSKTINNIDLPKGNYTIKLTARLTRSLSGYESVPAWVTIGDYFNPKVALKGRFDNYSSPGQRQISLSDTFSMSYSDDVSLDISASDCVSWTVTIQAK